MGHTDAPLPTSGALCLTGSKWRRKKPHFANLFVTKTMRRFTHFPAISVKFEHKT